MFEVIAYLNNPQLVANFQKIFGIESHFDSNGIIHSAPTVSLNGRKTRKSVKTESLSESPKKTQNGQDELNGSAEKEQKEAVKTQKSKHRRQLSLITDHQGIMATTIIHNKFWYYLFHLGAAMGNEIFYCLFFPFWFWNVDGAIARKVGFLWGIFMYIGQATKDLLCMPRPASPPVVKLEERYVAEYGFPSTHAMVSAGLPISLVVLSYTRYNIDLTLSMSVAALFCFWVCCSRLYLGMHSLLDVIAGVLYSMLVLMCVIPILEPIDKFMIENEWSPMITLTLGFSLCYYYPSLKKWSTARGDTTIIIGTVVGFSVGSFLNSRFGFLNRPDEPPLYDIHFPTAFGYILAVVRTVLGLLSLLATRQFFKSSVLRLLCFLNGMDSSDPACKQVKKIELPYYYITYFFIGLNTSFMSPFMFRLLNIERDYSFTEL